MKQTLEESAPAYWNHINNAFCSNALALLALVSRKAHSI